MKPVEELKLATFHQNNIITTSELEDSMKTTLKKKGDDERDFQKTEKNKKKVELYLKLMRQMAQTTADQCLTQGLNLTYAGISPSLITIGGFKDFVVVEDNLRPIFSWMTLRDVLIAAYLYGWWYHGSTKAKTWPLKIVGWLVWFRAVKYYMALTGCHTIVVVAAGVDLDLL